VAPFADRAGGVVIPNGWGQGEAGPDGHRAGLADRALVRVDAAWQRCSPLLAHLVGRIAYGTQAAPPEPEPEPDFLTR
jgi:hypothetical protein